MLSIVVYTLPHQKRRDEGRRGRKGFSPWKTGEGRERERERENKKETKQSWPEGQLAPLWWWLYMASPSNIYGPFVTRPALSWWPASIVIWLSDVFDRSAGRWYKKMMMRVSLAIKNRDPSAESDYMSRRKIARKALPVDRQRIKCPKGT